MTDAESGQIVDYSGRIVEIKCSMQLEAISGYGFNAHTQAIPFVHACKRFDGFLAELIKKMVICSAATHQLERGASPISNTEPA
jgi:hypothetical protein